MTPRAHSAQFLGRQALLLALICLWISGGATLRHTDPPLFYAVGHSALGHATMPPTELPCAACEWEQGLSDPHVPSLSVVSTPQIRHRYADGLQISLHALSFDYTALRGPPSDLT